MEHQVNSTNGAPKIISDKLALVYDESGKILHIHRVTTLDGGRSRSDDEITRAALEYAKHGRYKDLVSSKANVLVVEPHEMKVGHTHRIDVASRTLRAEPRKR
jgi:hypothetical protein